MSTIKEWKKDDRPREKMITQGASSLSDTELLALLINSGTRSRTAVTIARELLKEADNSLNTLAGFSIDRMESIDGIGHAKATRLAAMFELAGRLESEPEEESPIITSSESIARIFSPLLRNLKHEECWIVYLNRSNRIISKEKMSSGGISATVVDLRLIIKKAVEKLASSIIMIHNHPSGNPHPGEHDIRQTRLLKEAASLLDITLIDHIIIAGNKYYSFSDERVR